MLNIVPFGGPVLEKKISIANISAMIFGDSITGSAVAIDLLRCPMQTIATTP